MKNKYIIILILFLAFILRIWGISYGLPFFLVGDEQSQVVGALRMAELKTLVPALHPEQFNLLYYPPLGSYIYLVYLIPIILFKYISGGFASFSELGVFIILNPGFIWLAARILVAIVGTASVGCLYLAAKRMFGQKTGYLAALFLALSFFHIQLSHFTRHWAPACFFTILSLYFAWLLTENPQNKKYYLLSGLIGGLAFGITYITAIAFLLPIFSYFFLVRGNFSQKIKNKNFWLMIGLFLILVIIFIALYPQEFIKITLGEDTGAKSAKNLAGLFFSFCYYFLNLFYFEPIILFFSLAGLILLFLKSKKIFALISFFPIVYILLFYFLFHQEVRYTLLLVPFLAILAAYALNYLLDFLKKGFLKFLIVLLIIIYPLSLSAKLDLLLSQKDTRMAAKDWIEQNLAPGSKIIVNLEGVKITPSKAAIERQSNLDPATLRTIDKTLLTLPPERYPRPSYETLDLPFVENALPQDIVSYAKENDFHYFVIAYWQKEDLSGREQVLTGAGKLIVNFSQNKNGANYNFLGNFQGPAWNLFQIDRFGPTVEIREL